MVLETIKIIDGNRRGFKIINKCDFDSRKDKEYFDKPKTTRAKKVK